ncbi:carph-isopro domain-containing protein [Acetobacter okinawensis]|uniref:carph-isopro domain-containing protein n=1 Tax=Acetobacter okinawensis TaxID=1076594 RepID=UPI000A3B938E
MSILLDKVICAAGGVTALARAVEVSPASICGWRRRGRIPFNRIPDVSKATGIKISELCPEFFAEDVRPATNGELA